MTISRFVCLCLVCLLASAHPQPGRGQQPDSEPLRPDAPLPIVDSRDRPLSAITTDIAPKATKLPEDFSTEIIVNEPVPIPRVAEYFYWEAPELWHHPLYFDDVQLERYGQTPKPKLQPFLSGAHFFGTLPLLPYKMGIDPPKSCVTNLGYYRPGSPAPCVGRRLPWDRRAALYESGAWVGLFLLLP
jgi:hypothetical protein